MRTYPLLDADGRLLAFEVSSLAGRRAMRRIAAAIPGAGISSVSLRNDLFCEFTVAGERFGIEEPFGDNSRFWVGPLDGGAREALSFVHSHFAASALGAWMGRLGVLFCAALLLLALLGPVRGFIQQDRCLDAGGRWDRATAQCEGAPPP